VVLNPELLLRINIDLRGEPNWSFNLSQCDLRARAMWRMRKAPLCLPASKSITPKTPSYWFILINLIN